MTTPTRPTRIGPFPSGVNNVAKEKSLPKNELGATIAARAARNVDFDNDGWWKMRRGRVNRVAATRAHSLFTSDSHLLAVVDGDLVAYDANLTETVLLAGIGDRYATAAQAPHGDVYWSNGSRIARIDDSLTVHPVWPDTPASPVLAAAVSGGLAAGEYMVTVTAIDVSGRESGASPPVAITVAANGGIMLTNLPTVPSAISLRIYCTPPSGDVPYRVATLPIGQPAYMIAAHTPGAMCETQWLQPLPPAHILRFWNGRVLAASGNVLTIGAALRFGLAHFDDTLVVGARIHMMEPVGDGDDSGGVFVADQKRTYWLSGDKPSEWRRVVRYPHSAVEGTSLTVPGNAVGINTTEPVAVWLASNGVFVRGLPGGNVQPIREGELAVPVGERGTMVYNEADGIRRLLTSFKTGEKAAFAVRDEMSGSIIRNGIVLDA